MNRTENPVAISSKLERLTYADALVPIRKIVIDEHLLGSMPYDPEFAAGYFSIPSNEADIPVLLAQDDRTETEAQKYGKHLYRKGEILDAATIKKINSGRSDTTESTLNILADPEVIINFCFWQNKQEAQSAANGPEHKIARGMALDNHAEYHIFTWDVARVSNNLIFVPERHNYYNAAKARTI